ncbi:MAG: putative Ig domain-containing protein, partial [Terracidiphilus sp.]
PFVLAAGPGDNLWVTDDVNSNVYEVAPNGQVSATISGDPLDQPTGVAVDGKGQVYIANTVGNSVVKATPGPGGSYTLTDIIDGDTPRSIAVDRMGSLYIANRSDAIQVLPWFASPCLTLDGCPPLIENTLDPNSLTSTITGVASDGPGDVFFADGGTAQVLRAGGASDSPLDLVADSNLDGIAASDDMRVAVDSSANVFILDTGNNRVLEEARNAAGDYLPFTLLGAGDGISLGAGGDIAVDADDNVYITDTSLQGAGARRVLKVNRAGAPALAFNQVIVNGSASRTLTIANTGNQSLSYQMSASGASGQPVNPYSLDGDSTCPTTSPTASAGSLDPGTSCSIIVVFSPVQGGPNQGLLTVTTNTLNVSTTQTSDLSGSGTAAITLAPATLTGGTVGVPYAGIVSASGGEGSYSYAISAGGLPDGVSLGADGSLAGTPATAGNFSFTITATDANDASGSQDFAVTIAKGTPILHWSIPAPISQGTALSAAQLSATASVPGSFVYNPPAGTMLEAGSQTLAVTFTPADGNDYNPGAASVVLTVNPPPAPVVRLSVSLTAPITTDGSGNYVASLVIANHGNATATGVQVSSAAVVVNQGGLKTTATMTPLPLAAGSIAANGTTAVTLTFPASAGHSGAAALRIGVAYAGGSTSATLRAALP